MSWSTYDSSTLYTTLPHNFEGAIWVLIDQVPVYCILVTSTKYSNGLEMNVT